MASFLVPSHLGAPGPAGPSTPALSNQDHFWEPASLPANSIRSSLGTAAEKGEQHGCIRWEEDQGPPWG